MKNLDFLRAFNVLVSREAPQLYSEKKLIEINMFLERFLLHHNFSSEVLHIEENDKKEAIKNAHQSETNSDDEIKKPNKSPKNDKKNAFSSGSGSSSIVIPELPEFFKAIIISLGGTDVTFVMQKEVNKTDLERNNNRLAMPEKQINEECKFLALKDPAMMRIFEARDENNRLIGMEVGLIEPCGEVCDQVLKRWNMTSASTYNLASSSWIRIAQRNHLKIGHLLNIWCFNVNTKFYFLLHRI
ncbi:hypothetical protein HN51_013782 [Arachis hypogaea]|uniref:Uncharacterized protein n=1 Tax=Arachis hypogaea TaxID=3818 RepID=A0A445DNR4_ARAHY|nr:uncharacterized protein LOC107633942 [Arachis ipaensis]RYR64805.1 hypothetical protein Ahy_A03g010848 [Arachis hypogaea]